MKYNKPILGGLANRIISFIDLPHSFGVTDENDTTNIKMQWYLYPDLVPYGELHTITSIDCDLKIVLDFRRIGHDVYP